MDDRRGFLRRTVAALGGVFAALFGVPAVATVVDPALRGAGHGWRDAGPLAGLAENAPRRFTYEVAAGWEQRQEVGFLLRNGDGVVALSARCTHLGCTVRPADDGFLCPCHGGAFSLSGKPVKGPPEKPLVRFETRVRDGRVEVRA